jgi:hypothetical protein
MENLNIPFILTLISCSISLYVFNRALLRKIGVNYITGPYAIFSVVYFIVAPFVNIYFDVYVQKGLMSNVPANDMAWLNIANTLGLAIATLGARIIRPRNISMKNGNNYNFSKLQIITTILFPLVLFVGVYNNFIAGNLLGKSDDPYATGQSVYLYIFIESTPLIFCWSVSTYYYLKGRLPKPSVGILILIFHFVVTVSVNFSRGSRVSMLIQLILGFMIFNNWIIRFRTAHYLIACSIVALLIPGYAYYKYAGTDALLSYASGKGKAEVAESFNHPGKFIVGDIARADIQAPLLYGLINDKFDPVYWPETYLSGFMLLIPSPIRPNFFRDKTMVGAEAQLRLDPSTPLNFTKLGVRSSSRIYALLGEAILNFGIAAIPFAFFIFGVVSRMALVRAVNQRSWRDVLVSPFFAMLPIYILFYDFDNMIFQTVVVWGFPMLILLIARTKVWRIN